MPEKIVVRKVEGTAEVTSMVVLIIGVGVAVLLLIFVGVLGGQAYSLVEPDIQGINDTTIQTYIKDSITSGFKSLSLTGQYLPLVVLAVVISVVITLIMGFGTSGFRATSTAL